MQFDHASIMVFPGQGSQRLGMLKDYADSFPVVQDTFNAMSAICKEDLWSIVQNGPKEKIDDTRITQPVMFAADLAIWKVWQVLGGCLPSMVAGHSLGEYAALVVSGVLNFEDAGKLVYHRARLMANAFSQGEGAVGVLVHATQVQVQEWCDACSKPESEIKHQVWIANINSPIQFVIAGHKAAVEKVLQLATDHKIKIAMLLPVSVPVHCPLMKETADNLRLYFDEVAFNTPKIPIVFNVDALCHRSPDSIKQALYEQLFKPVQWVKSMEVMMQSKPNLIVESGPGGVLTGLFNRTYKQSDCKMQSLHGVSDLQELFFHE